MACTAYVQAADVPAGVKLAKVQEIVRGNGDEVPTLDPTFSSDTASSRVIQDMFEGLVSEGLNGDVIPALAKSWEVDETGMVYTYHLREDALWSNGQPITANDFEYSLKRAINPATAAPYAWYLTMARFKNAEAINKGEKSIDELGVEAVDARTLKITLDQPVPYFTKMMVHPSTYPVYKDVVEKYGDSWTKPEHIVTSSAYKLSKWVLNERIILERNERYWNNDKTVINQVTYLPIQDLTAEYNRFRTGEIDITSSFPLEQYKAIKQERPNELLTMPSLGTYYYLFNMDKAPFDDARVRKALAYSIDRNVVTNIILGQGQLPAYGVTPPSVSGFEAPKLAWGEISQKERNKKAKELLAEAGYGPSNPLEFELVYNTSESHKKLALVVSSMWKKNLGVNVELANQEWKTFLEKLSAKDFELARYAWVGDYNEASTFLSYFESHGMNYSGWSNIDYDKAMAGAIKAPSDNKRNQFYQKAELVFAEEMPAIPLYFYTRSVLKQTKVGGYSIENAGDARFTRDMYITQ
ncbi:peptide ABC transporter substrate-binding protein [Photobacterium sanguinicancri]|nr:peptide ABC transporter substrate-binding protein [Photobacterium sanguinicancri]MDO6499932.1 peptide ABC transporter substrate-binding protein [Photobacterium sanguinicancri]